MTSRRALVLGAAAAMGAAPTPATASERVHRSIAALRGRWEGARADFVSRAMGKRSVLEEERPRVESLGDGMAALGALKGVGLPTVAEQAHPAFQAFLLDVAAAVGRAVVCGAEALDRFLPGADLAAEGALRRELERLREELPTWDAEASGREQVDAHVRSLLREGGSGALLRGAGRVRERARKAERLGKELVDRDWASGAVAGDPALSPEEVVAARARWATEGEAIETPSYGGGAQATYVAIGVLLLGLIFVEGLLFLVALCGASCSGNGTAVVLVIVLGLLILGLTVYGAIWAFSKAVEEGRKKRRRAEPAVEPSLPESGD